MVRSKRLKMNEEEQAVEDFTQVIDRVKDKVLEHGQIFFFYRAKVDAEKVHKFADVSKFYILLKPNVILGGLLNFAKSQERGEGTELRQVATGHARWLVVAKKRLPKIKSHEKVWGFVQKTVNLDFKEFPTKEQRGEMIQFVDEVLSGETYETKTRGSRVVSEAMFAGEGHYAILDGTNHTNSHLIYTLTNPESPSEIQKSFEIEQQGCYVISVKNPKAKSRPGVGLPQDQKAAFPKEFDAVFQDYSFVKCLPPMLDYKGAEILLIGLSQNIAGSFGKDIEEMIDYEAELQKSKSDMMCIEGWENNGSCEQQKEKIVEQVTD